jgi:hypothetical protein
VYAVQISTFTDLAALAAIISFLGGIGSFLFKKIVIEPLKQSIDQLNHIIEGFKDTAEKRMGAIENRVDKLEDRASRHDEKISTVFNTLKDLKEDKKNE